MKLNFAGGLFVAALIAFYVAPTAGAPKAVADPQCDSSSGGGGDLLDLNVFLDVDLSGLGDILNALLVLLIGVSSADKCEYPDYAAKMQSLIDVDLYLYLNLLGIEVRLNLQVMLGPLLRAVLQLVLGLLAGVLGDVLGVVNIVLGLLSSLGLSLNAAVGAQLGDLVNLNVLALLNIG